MSDFETLCKEVRIVSLAVACPSLAALTYCAETTAQRDGDGQLIVLVKCQ
jgi:hypothetical protein